MPTIQLEHGRTVSEHSLICSGERCDDRFRQTIDTKHTYGWTGGHLWEILYTAGAMLGWRRVLDPNNNHKDYCPYCSSKNKLVCARCLHAECSCMGGPRFLAVRP